MSNFSIPLKNLNKTFYFIVSIIILTWAAAMYWNFTSSNNTPPAVTPPPPTDELITQLVSQSHPGLDTQGSTSIWTYIFNEDISSVSDFSFKDPYTNQFLWWQLTSYTINWNIITLNVLAPYSDSVYIEFTVLDHFWNYKIIKSNFYDLY